MPRARRSTSKRPSKARYDICAEDELQNTARHLTVMNKNAQLELAGYSKHYDLPYCDKIEFDDKEQSGLGGDAYEWYNSELTDIERAGRYSFLAF